MTSILGISAFYHDSAAALIIDGEIAAAAQEAIQQEKNAAINDIKAQVAELSVDIAQKVLQGELSDQKKQEQLVEKLVNDIEIK